MELQHLNLDEKAMRHEGILRLGKLFEWRGSEEPYYQPSLHVMKHAVDIRGATKDKPDRHPTGDKVYTNYQGVKYDEYIDGTRVRHLTLPE